MDRSERNYLIDLLRGYGVLTVLFRHGSDIFPVIDALPNFSGKSYFVSFLFFSGQDGVRIFFIISGFLITNLSLKRWGTLGNISLKTFYVYRFTRIIPPLTLLLFFLTIFHLFKVKYFYLNENFSYFELLFASLGFHINWLESIKGFVPMPWSVLWTLNIEEVFYLIFPIVLILLKKNYLIYLMLIIFVFYGPYYRYINIDSFFLEVKGYFACFDAIALGSLTSIFAKYSPIKNQSKKFLRIIGYALIFFVLIFKLSDDFLFLTEFNLYKVISAIGTVLLLLSSTFSKRTPNQKNLICSIGENCYEIYLFHMFSFYLVLEVYNLIGNSDYLSIPFFLLSISLAILLGFIINHFFSKPINSFLRKKLLKQAAKT